MRLVAAIILVAMVIAAPVAAQKVFVSTVVIGMSTRQANTYTFSAVPVPRGVKGLQITMDLSEAPDPPTPLPVISVQLECSLDGGLNWQGPGSAGSFQRSFVPEPKSLNRTRTGLQQTTGASFGGGLCWNDIAAANPNRQLRGSASIGGTLRFGLTVQPL